MDRAEATKALDLLRKVVNQTRDDSALQNWGIIWIVHGVSNGLGFIATDVMRWSGVEQIWPYPALWTGIVTFNIVSIFVLKGRRPGVRSFVEQQIWAIWLTFIAAVILCGLVNHLLGLELFLLGPAISILAAVAMSSMGALIGARYFVPAIVFAVNAIVMAIVPDYQFLLLGCVWVAVQTTGGLQLHREKKKQLAEGTTARLV